MKITLTATLLCAALVAGCQQVQPPDSRTDAAGNTVIDWPIPAGAGSAEPDLFLAPDGRLLLSWIKPFDGVGTKSPRQALQFTTFNRSGQWQWAPKNIAVGASMMVNWADTPHIAATADGAIWAQWLQRTRGRDGTGAMGSYDIIMARSEDDGMHWSSPIRPHSDGQPVEHGFVSFWPAARERIGIAWLDGRNTVKAGGMMSLRSAAVDATPSVQDSLEVDDTVCDCCGTDVAMTTRGPLLVYRNRSEDEIRDVYATRLDVATWSAPKAVHDDGWKIDGCPVNGPAIAAEGNNAVVAWYMAAADMPTLQLARTTDAGDSFAAPVVVDRGNAVQGRVDVALDKTQAWVAWLREDGQDQSLWLARYAPDLSRQLAKIEVAKVQGRGRGTGFPKLAVREGEAYIVWTDIIGGTPQLRGARVTTNGR